MRRPGKILCIGQNYRAHIAELKGEVPPDPVIFIKPATALIANGEDILVPPGLGRVDYEGELAVVIGKKCKGVGRSEALGCVGALAVFNDVTARDMQSRARKAGMAWDMAKGMDTFAPMSEPNDFKDVPDVHGLSIQTRLNGNLKQNGNTADMMYPVEELIAYITRYMTLEAGDVIATGTPEGVGPIAPGDVVEVEISGVGKLRNPVRSA
ncbi:MAG: fumarylacetoacetate hydrolase family protein [Methanomassiliicoccales archaeon]|nr:fumarylacetoacetate hydrolase family protein [Methanomassiliicoccales archaeon]